MKVIKLDVYDPSRNDKQMAYHRAPHVYKLYGGAMGGGKTAALINEGIKLSLKYPGNDGLLLRKLNTSFTYTVLPQLKKFMHTGLVANWNHSKQIITLINGSLYRYGGMGDNPTDWEKFMSGEYGWVALDQAEDFTEEDFVMLCSRLRHKLPGIHYHFLLACNPAQGWIKETFIENNLPDHIFIPALPQDNIANLPADYIPRLRDKFTPKLAAAYLDGDWDAIGDPDNVYTYKSISVAMARSEAAGPPYEFGVDVARSGEDKSVIALRQGLVASIVHVAQGHDIMRTAGEVWVQVAVLAARLTAGAAAEKEAAAAEAARVAKDALAAEAPVEAVPVPVVTIKVDCDGLGAGVYDRLKELRREKQQLLGITIRLLEIHGSGKPTNKVKYKNLRAEMHFGLLEMLDVIQLPKDRELQAQMLSLKYNTNSAGQLFILPKEEIKKKLGRSPDEAEAIIYAFGLPQRVPQPRIRSLV